MTTVPRKLVLLPGLDGSGLLFDELKAGLVGSRSVESVAYPDDPAQTYASLTAYVRGLIGSEKVILLGESFGGPLAISVAAEMPDQVQGLILAATFAKNPWPAWMMRLAARAGHATVPRRLLHAVLFGKWGTPERRGKLDLRLDQLPHSLAAQRLREGARIDVRERLYEVRCPILVLHGRRDWLVAVRPWRRVWQRVLRSNPRANLKLIDGPHMLLQSCAAECADEISTFCQNIEAGS